VSICENFLQVIMVCGRCWEPFDPMAGEGILVSFFPCHLLRFLRLAQWKYGERVIHWTILLIWKIEHVSENQVGQICNTSHQSSCSPRHSSQESLHLLQFMFKSFRISFLLLQSLSWIFPNFYSLESLSYFVLCLLL
jgi:hypothetical protein